MFEEDLAERVDELFCFAEGGVGDRDMDTISMLLTGWIIFVFCAVAFIKYLYLRFVKKTNFAEVTSSIPSVATVAVKDVSSETVIEEKSNTSTNATPNKIVNNVKESPASVVRRRRNIQTESIIVESIAEPTPVSLQCIGPDTIVTEYITNCYNWLYSVQTLQDNSWDDLRETFMDSLNKVLREEDKKSSLILSIAEVFVKENIKVANLFAECEHANNIKITADCEAQLYGKATVSSIDTGSKRFDFMVDRLCGRLNILFDSEERLVIVKFDGWPEICTGISSTTPSKSNQLDHRVTEIVSERITSAIRNVVVDFELRRFSDFPSPPVLTPKVEISENAKKYLLVKVVRGTKIGLFKGCNEPYCVVELDDPPQKFQTDAHESHDPIWNENFVFNVVPGGGEILFEAYDKIGTRFLGCNIISVEEILDEKTRVLPLKSRRMEVSEQITGALEVNFTFLDEKEFIQKSKETIERISPSGNLIKTTKTTFTKPPSAPSGDFTEEVIKEFEKNSVSNANKSTLIIHAVQRNISNSSSHRPIVKIEKLPDGRYTEVKDNDPLKDKVEKPKEVAETGLEGQYGEERGRRRTRRGDIFTSIRRRFSKTRSRSQVPDNETGGTNRDAQKEEIFARSISADRNSMLSGRHLGLMGLHSTRSSASELSAISGQSTSTYYHESSTLVIECVENRIRKYYLVPPNLAQTGKWKKRGKKLHIYNDHTFVAKHVQSGTTCEICSSRFSFSLGKQGYQCRDCKMKCHKECHIRAPSYCPKTTVYDIELGTTKCVPQSKSFSSVCSSFLSGKKGHNSKTNKECITNGTDKNNLKLQQSAPLTNPRKKSNIFRRVSKLKKISEENLCSNDKIKIEDQGDHLEEVPLLPENDETGAPEDAIKSS